MQVAQPNNDAGRPRIAQLHTVRHLNLYQPQTPTSTAYARDFTRALVSTLRIKIKKIRTDKLNLALRAQCLRLGSCVATSACLKQDGLSCTNIGLTAIIFTNNLWSYQLSFARYPLSNLNANICAATSGCSLVLTLPGPSFCTVCKGMVARKSILWLSHITRYFLCFKLDFWEFNRFFKLFACQFCLSISLGGQRDLSDSKCLKKRQNFQKNGLLLLRLNYGSLLNRNASLGFQIV